MKDKSLGIWLIILFGVSGLAAISLGWLLPWLESERILTTLAGLAGILIALIQVFVLRQSIESKKVPVEIETENES